MMTMSRSVFSPVLYWPLCWRRSCLRLRNRAYRIIAENETRDDDGDGIPDVYQPTD